MVDITRKIVTHRRAHARATVVVSTPDTIRAIVEHTVPKGNVLEFARASAMLAVKQTSSVIPDCHPIPLQHCTVDYRLTDLTIDIDVEVAAIYRTGVEVEAMHGAMIAALTMYDMLKPIDKHLKITDVQLVKKKGGKTSFADAPPVGLMAAVVVSSDSVSSGVKEDSSGKAIKDKLTSHGVEVFHYGIVPDEESIIVKTVLDLCSKGAQLVIITGGTGLSPRDRTPEAVLPILERTLPGVEEAIRSFGQERTPYSMLSRSVAGVIGNTIILALPGSTRGAEESMDAIFPALFHAYPMMLGRQHKRTES